MMCERVGLMIAYDDNDSLRREEILGVSRFEGAAVGTKTAGIKQQVRLAHKRPATWTMQ